MLKKNPTFEAGKKEKKSKDRFVRKHLFETIEIPADIDPYLVRKFAHQHFVYSLLGLIIGLICVIFGIILIIGGYGASTNFVIKLLDAKAELSDAIPGTILFIIGIFFVLATRYNIKIHK